MTIGTASAPVRSIVGSRSRQLAVRGARILLLGIIVVVVVQIGLISPPVGMNIFVVKNLIRHLSIGTVFRGVSPFTAALVALLAILVAVPALATYLPGLMK